MSSTRGVTPEIPSKIIFVHCILKIVLRAADSEGKSVEPLAAKWSVERGERIMKFTSSTVRLELCLVVIFLGTCTDAKAAGVPDENDCIVDREGKTLVMTFCLRKYSQAPGAFYAHLIRERNMTADILTCDKTNGKISCIGVDHTFHVEGVIEDALKVRVPNVSSNRVETFLLRVFFNETRQPPIVCNLTMTEINSYTEDKANNPGIRDGSIAGILIAIVIIIAIVVGGIYFIYR
ncbi:uncharacterized protein, partial [Littorina saxatilis]|uniref:uncharacterized protein n=1 Tax=Littorina saxatilis TaxID=31220 RepID=UPI0038B503DD